MLNIEGALQVVPVKVGVDSGNIKVDENTKEPAVIQTLFTANGIVQIVIPSAAIDGLIEGLVKSKKESEKEGHTTELYVPQSQSEVESMAKAQQELKGETEQPD